MAYATKYLFKWESVNGTTREIRVLLDGYSGSVIQRRLGRAPVLKKQHNGNVYGTSLEFYAECSVDGEFAEFYTSDPKAYRVDLYAGSTLLWQGYITPELYSEPDIAPPYDVQVVATDGIGELKLYDFAPLGTVTLRALLGQLLGYTGLTTDVYLISSIKPGGSGAAGSLLEKSINLDYKAGETCYEVLSYLLDTLHATITWWKGAWILARETNVKFSSGKVQYFNTSGNAGTLAGSVVTLGKMYTNDAWPVGQLTTKVDPAKNSVRIQAPWHPVTALQNSEMTSDTAWTKVNDAVYDTTNKCYHLPATGLTTIPRISQSLSLSALKTSMILTGKFTGVSADLPLALTFAAKVGFYVTYEVSGTTYHIERTDDGIVWKQGATPTVFNYLNCIYADLTCFDEDEVGAQELSLEIPPFVSGLSFPAGTLTVMVFGGCARVFSTTLDVVVSKGYQDNLYLDNGARGEGGEIEIAIGRETSAVASFQNFLQGLLLDSGSLITSFKDDYITASGLDWMSFIARDYARSYALPRLVRTGTVSLESAVTFPPLVFTKGAVDYWLEGYSWNMLDDELEISARSLPNATITVDSEVITEAGGTASSSASQSSGSSSGGGFAPGGINYLETNASLETLVQLKSAYNYFGPKKGLIFDTVPEADVASSPAHLMLRNLGTPSEPNYALYTPYAIISGGDQIVGSGTPGGGGGGGASNLYELNDVSVPHPYSTSHPADGDALVWDNTNSRWTNKPVGTVMSAVTSLGGVDGDITLGTGLSMSGQVLSVAANTYVKTTGDAITGAINFNGTSAYMALTRTSGGTPETWFAFDASTQILGPAVGTTTIRSGYASLYHYRGNTSYEIYTAHNLTKSVLTTLLDSSNGYYLPLAGGTMSGTITWPASNSTVLQGLGGTVGGTGMIFYSLPNSGQVNMIVGMAPASGYTTSYLYLRTSAGLDLYHTKGATNYTIWDAGNSNSTSVPWTASIFSTPSYVNFISGTTQYGFLGKADSSNNDIYLSAAQTTGALRLGAGGNTSDVYVSTGHLVGIGTTSPGYKLDVNGDAAVNNVIYFKYAGWNSLIADQKNGGLRFFTTTNDDTPATQEVLRLNPNRSAQFFSSLTVSGTIIGSTYLYLRGGALATNTTTTRIYARDYYNLSDSAAVDRIIVSFAGVAGANPVLGIGSGTYTLCATYIYGKSITFRTRNGSSDVNATLSSAGVFTTAGDQVISSDINLKTNLKDITLTSEQIANAPAVSFDWKDGHGHSFGSIAQYWKSLVPEAVLGEEGSYTLAYGQLGVVLGINNGKAIFKLEQHETEQDKEIRRLKKEVAELRTDNLRMKSLLNLS